MNSNLRVAVIHDWLTIMGGAEYTLNQILQLFPQADIYTIVDILPIKDRKWLEGHKIYTSPLQKFSFLAQRYRHMLWMMPFWIEQFDLGQYDLIISDSHAVAKGVIVHPHQKHLAYIYSPMRYAWDLGYEHDNMGVMGSGLKRFLMKKWFHQFRVWDCTSSYRADEMIAISDFIRKRIKKTWGRDSTVIYPPVDISTCPFSDQKGDYYVTVSRLVPYKKVDLIINTFATMPEKKLIVIGEGPLFDKMVKNLPDNVTMKGYLPREEMLSVVAKAKGFIFMPKEDFGIAPLEAQACGTPVIAYGVGGARETVRTHENATGIFVNEQTSWALKNAIQEFELNYEKFSPAKCRQWAQNFSDERFRKEFFEATQILIKDL